MDPWKNSGHVWDPFTGGVNLLDPDPDTIDIRSISRSLDRQLRWNGMTELPITIAQHCCWLEELAPPDLKIHCLLHDAAEAYIGDIPSPLKSLLGPEIREIEARLLSTIYRKLGVTEPDWDYFREFESHTVRLEHFLGRLPACDWLHRVGARLAGSR